jgi:hypothetical protein
MQRLTKPLAAVALAAGIVLGSAGTASAATSHRPTASHQVAAEVAAPGEWRFGGLFSTWITCTLDGKTQVANPFNDADDYQCLPPGPGGTHWTLMLYYE